MDPNLDHAIETAAEHTREAEERLIQEPVESPEVVTEARTVERRAEDLHELAEDATTEHPEAESQPSP
jgi:hypothetical protein